MVSEQSDTYKVKSIMFEARAVAARTGQGWQVSMGLVLAGRKAQLWVIDDIQAIQFAWIESEVYDG